MWVVSEADEDEVSRPASLVDLPAVEREAAGGVLEYSDMDWVIKSDYHGRFVRNQTAVRLQEWK